MALKLPVIDASGEVGDLSDIDPALFQPFSALPESLQAKLRGRPKAAVNKERVTLRLSPEVVQAFRASGKGWQTRVNEALREWVKTHQ